MKKIVTITFVFSSALIILMVLGMRTIKHEKSQVNNALIVVDIPENVQAVIDKSCVMCHSDASSNLKAKLNVSYDKFKTGDYSVAKVVGKMNDISKVMDDKSMPPKKFIEKNPDKAMTDAERKLLKTWALETISKYSEE